MTTEQKKSAYYEWVGQRIFLSQLIGEKFKEPLKADGKTKEDDVDVLWDFYQNYNIRQAQELQRLREELRNA